MTIQCWFNFPIKTVILMRIDIQKPDKNLMTQEKKLYYL